VTGRPGIIYAKKIFEAVERQNLEPERMNRIPGWMEPMTGKQLQAIIRYPRWI
jgi:hypothetical protein